MYSAKTQGDVHYIKRLQQPINFNKIQIGKIVPCDIDIAIGLKFQIEYQDKAWIFIEIKYRDAEFPTGQKLMHERLVKDLEQTNKPTLFILAEHYVDDPAQTVDAATCVVRQIYFKGEWLVPKGKYKLKDVVDRFIASVS